MWERRETANKDFNGQPNAETKTHDRHNSCIAVPL